jgi:hypothetical protein
MMDPRTKRAEEIQDSIRQVLFRDWDPLDVNSNPNLQDEYDSFIAPIYRILTESRSEEELMECLSRAGDSLFGQPSNKSSEPLRPIAQKLLKLNVKL